MTLQVIKTCYKLQVRRYRQDNITKLLQATSYKQDLSQDISRNRAWGALTYKNALTA